MKHYTFKTLCAMAAAAVMSLTSCEKDLQAYDNPDCRLNFCFKTTNGDGYATTEDIKNGYVDVEKPTIYNFKFSGDITQDTVWVVAQTMGFVADYDRQYDLEQVMIEGEENAVPGTDYASFDTDEAKRIQVVKAGETMFKVPVIVKRAARQQDKTLMLKIRFRENASFKAGYSCMQECIVAITDRLSKPSVWDEFRLDYTFGYYGEMKHQLMIEWSGQPWDDTYITEMYNTDSGYLDYMDQVFAKRLAEENAKRMAQGLDVWREADGTEVDFTPASWW